MTPVNHSHHQNGRSLAVRSGPFASALSVCMDLDCLCTYQVSLTITIASSVDFCNLAVTSVSHYQLFVAILSRVSGSVEAAPNQGFLVLY